MADGNPPDSWYDPPEPRHDIEIKWSRALGYRAQCDRCEEVADMEGAIGDVRYQDGKYFAYCKNHFDTAIDDMYDDLESEIDWDEEDL